MYHGMCWSLIYNFVNVFPNTTLTDCSTWLPVQLACPLQTTNDVFRITTTVCLDILQKRLKLLDWIDLGEWHDLEVGIFLIAFIVVTVTNISQTQSDVGMKKLNTVHDLADLCLHSVNEWTLHNVNWMDKCEQLYARSLYRVTGGICMQWNSNSYATKCKPTDLHTLLEPTK